MGGEVGEEGFDEFGEGEGEGAVLGWVFWGCLVWFWEYP